MLGFFSQELRGFNRQLEVGLLTGLNMSRLLIASQADALGSDALLLGR